jgi:hypothetical protein
MARKCSVCTHPKLAEINRAVLASGVSDTNLDEVAKLFGVSRYALMRHKAHVVEILAVSPTNQLAKITDVDGIVSEIQDLERHGADILADAKKSKDRRSALAAITTLKNLLEFRAQVSGAMKPQHQTNNLHLHLGGEKDFNEKLGELIERNRLFPVERRGESKALPPSA